MCKLAFGINITQTEEAAKQIRNILDAQYEDMKSQKDGIATFYASDESPTPIVERALDGYHVPFLNLVEKIPTARIFGVHTRIATTGETTIANTHFNEKNGLYFAHNGYVNGLSERKYLGSDSSKWDRASWGSSGIQRYNKTLKCMETIYPDGSKYQDFRNYDTEPRKAVIDISDEANIRYEPTALTKLDTEIVKMFPNLTFNPKEECVDCASIIDDKGFCKNHQPLPRKERKKLLPKGTLPDFGIPKKEEAIVATTKGEDKTDSAQFLDKIASEPTISTEVLERLISQYRFNGVACLVNSIAKKLYILATREVVIHTDFKNYAMFYSFKPENEPREVKSFLGIDFYLKGEEIKPFELSKGVYEIPYGLQQA